jgi:hypothetical protein
MVAPGDTSGLADALADMICEITVALIDPGARLRLDRGAFTMAEFAAAAREHVDRFSPEHIAALTRAHVERLLAPEFSAAVTAAARAVG